MKLFYTLAIFFGIPFSQHRFPITKFCIVGTFKVGILLCSTAVMCIFKLLVNIMFAFGKNYIKTTVPILILLKETHSETLPKKKI